jgi:hypothetical protein
MLLCLLFVSGQPALSWGEREIHCEVQYEGREDATMLEGRRLWKGSSQNKGEAVSRTNATMAKTEVKGQYLIVATTVYSMSDCSLTRSLTRATKGGLAGVIAPRMPN